MPAARLRSRWPSQNLVIFDFTSWAAPTMPLNSDSKFWVMYSQCSASIPKRFMMAGSASEIEPRLFSRI